MKFIVPVTQNAILNFFNAFSYLKNKYIFVDAYFLFFNQRIFISTLQSNFFNLYINWFGLQAPFIIFHYAKEYTSTSRLVYNYFSPYNISRDVVFLPFNWYTKRFVYWDNTALIRGKGGYFHIFSVGKTILGYINERFAQEALSGGSTLVVTDINGNQIPAKLEPNKQAFPLTTFLVKYPQNIEGFIGQFLNGRGSLTYSSAQGYNYNVQSTKQFYPEDILTNLDLRITIFRDASQQFNQQTRVLSQVGLDYIQSFQKAFIGQSLTAYPLNIINPISFPNTLFSLNRNDFDLPPLLQQSIYGGINVKLATKVDYYQQNSTSNSTFIFVGLYLGSYFYTVQYNQFTFEDLTNQKIYYQSDFPMQVQGHIIPNFPLTYQSNLVDFFSYSNNSVLHFTNYEQGNYDPIARQFDGSLYSLSAYVPNRPLDYTFYIPIQIMSNYDIYLSYYLNTTLIKSTNKAKIIKIDNSLIDYDIILVIVKSNPSEEILVNDYNSLPQNLQVFYARNTSTSTIVNQYLPNAIITNVFNQNPVFLRKNIEWENYYVYIMIANNIGQIISTQEIGLDLIEYDLNDSIARLIVFARSQEEGTVLQNLINNPMSQPQIISTQPDYNGEKILFLQNFPSANEVNGLLQNFVPNYPIYESGTFQTNKYCVTERVLTNRYQTNNETTTIQVINTTLNNANYEKLREFAIQGNFPFEFIFISSPLTNGIRVFKEAFNVDNYKNFENNVITILLVQNITWTFDNVLGLYVSQKIFYPELFYNYSAIGFDSPSTTNKQYTIIYSTLGVEIYNKQQFFSIQNKFEKKVTLKPFKKELVFNVWSDVDFETLIIYFSNQQTNKILY